ncbi:hypothetical protein NKDENANG_02938 [Candidatus Entotheonellaceae bacterium PAL068K]
MTSLDPLDSVLAAHRVGHLATANTTGMPHLVPVCFVYDGQTIYSALDHKPKRHTGYRMQRIRNIVANPHVAFLVDHYDEDWQQLYYVLIRGAASLLEQGDERQRALTLLEAKYVQYRERRLTDTAGLVIKITPTTVNRWSWQNPPR